MEDNKFGVEIHSTPASKRVDALEKRIERLEIVVVKQDAQIESLREAILKTLDAIQKFATTFSSRYF